MNEKTDYRKASPEALYEARKIVIRMWKSKKNVAEIIEATDFSQDTVYVTIRAYKKGGMNALMPKTRGRRIGEKRRLTAAQEQEMKMDQVSDTKKLSLPQKEERMALSSKVCN